MNITVSLTTKNRYYSTLLLALVSVANQSLLPYEVILVDDNEHKEFYNIEMYKNILELMKLKRIKFSYFHGPSKGQTHAQQVALEHCKTPLLFKMDDDNILQHNVLEILHEVLSENSNAAAASGVIFRYEKDISREADVDCNMYNRIEDIFSVFNVQMCGKQSKDRKKCEHLYSNYLFRKDLVKSYPLEFSPAGHREDTVFTYGMYLNGYDLIVDPFAITHHVHNSGGNKCHNFDDIVKNEELFIDKLHEWKVVPEKVQISREGNYVFAIKGTKKFIIYSK